MGGSRTGGKGGPSLWTVALTIAVLITGRLGTLQFKAQLHIPFSLFFFLVFDALVVRFFISRMTRKGNERGDRHN